MFRWLKQNFVLTRTQRPYRDKARPAFEGLSVSCRDAGQLWPATGTRALVAADLEGMDVAKVLLEEVAISSNIELPNK